MRQKAKKMKKIQKIIQIRKHKIKKNGDVLDAKMERKKKKKERNESK